MQKNILAGHSAPLSLLINVEKLNAAYYSQIPNPNELQQRVAFGTSGHRGSALTTSFNEKHILAICQAICEYRAKENIRGPLFLGKDTHALSKPAYQSALEVLAANGIQVMIADEDEFTPTPAVSRAILTYNTLHKEKADGIIITPSHNPPDEGGIKYNSPNGGPADQNITQWIEARANVLLSQEIVTIPFEKALKSVSTLHFNYLDSYVADLANVIDMEVIRQSGINIGVDPMGGAGVHYWKAIGLRYGLNLTVLNDTVDSTFRFMSVDWDGRIRMDPSSQFAMQSLIKQKDQFDIAFACDTDHDRHGIVTKSVGLLPTNSYLSVAIDYLFSHRPQWSKQAGVGKTVVSSQMIDRVTSKHGRTLYEVPVGFKWFVDKLLDQSLSFVGEESAGGTFARFDGTVWTTDKDGITLALLAAEIRARTGKDPGELYQILTEELGKPLFDRVEAKASPKQKEKLKKLSSSQVRSDQLAGEKISQILTHAPGNGAAIGGLKVVSPSGWFAARPSGTEDIYKIYAESFLDEKHLKRIIDEAKEIVDQALNE